CAAASGPATSLSATAATRRSSGAGLTLLLCFPAAFAAAVGPERSVHPLAGDPPGEIAPDADAVDHGEADDEPAQARVAQARLQPVAEERVALDLLEVLLEIQGDFFRAAFRTQLDRPLACHRGRNDPEVGAAAVQAGDLVGFPVFHGEGMGD